MKNPANLYLISLEKVGINIFMALQLNQRMCFTILMKKFLKKLSKKLLKN